MNNSKKSIRSLDDEPGGYQKDLFSCDESIDIQENWFTAYKNSIRNVDELSKFLPLSDVEKSAIKQVSKTYQMRIPLYFLSLVKDPHLQTDPVRRQCVPSFEEIQGEIHETIDPLGEEKTSPVPCLVHRYPDRALLIVTGRCFMYCRHCSRKRLWRNKVPEPTLKDIELALSYIKENKQIREIIISGGDPFTLPTERLDYILSSIVSRTNVEAIRIGTRAPVVIPQRIDESLCKVLAKHENLWINVQFNHEQEITSESIEACRKLQHCGIPLSNQSVLLKGINDSPQAMIALCQKLQSIRIRPYYLYQCDPVVGAWHFRTSIWRGIELVENMRGFIGGMCVPSFVVDGPEGKGKIPINPNYLLSVSPEGLTLRNYKNETFFYFNPKE